MEGRPELECPVQENGVAPIRAEFTLPPCQETSDGGEESRRQRGVNRDRPRDEKIALGNKVCPFLLSEQQCPYGDRCRYQHDLATFWRSKPADLDGDCPLFAKYGRCRYGIGCRFASQHTDEQTLRSVVKDTGLAMAPEGNELSQELRKKLIKRTYEFVTVGGEGEKDYDQAEDLGKCRLNIAGKLYLAPLTTLGNLPFRRLCVDFGAEVTCSEMAVASELLKGSRSEWALVRRHPCEKIFGVQLCGSKSTVLSRAAQTLVNEMRVDFVDINAGCPLDIICENGAGCMLMKKNNRLREIVSSMRNVLNGTPLTVKIRTGVRKDRCIAKEVVEVLKESGIDLVTLHGRSRDQRFTKLADWAYVDECAKAAAPMPLFGMGDVFSYTDYYTRLESTAVSGVAIGRAALIKPWLFTEIKERRHWDISAQERLDILKRYVNYGLEHWGTDQEGVNRTRRFLLEWLSFLYRYIPVGLLERLPQRMNDRPPRYYGRSDLETLMASDRSSDWVRLSEMLLGPVADDFQFEPKHKANAY